MHQDDILPVVNLSILEKHYLCLFQICCTCCQIFADNKCISSSDWDVSEVKAGMSVKKKKKDWPMETQTSTGLYKQQDF